MTSPLGRALRPEQTHEILIRKFIANHVKRGQGNYLFKKKFGNVDSFVKMRIWSSKNVILNSVASAKLPVVFALLVASFLCQQFGYVKKWMAEKNENKHGRRLGR
jgi:hypothetical protein